MFRVNVSSVRVPSVALALLACPILACGKIYTQERPRAGFDETTRSENSPGVAVDAPRPSTGEIPGETPPEPEPEAGGDCRPPPLVLESVGGEQAGVIASFCISGRGCARCIDGNLPPTESFTVAHSGDELTVGMPGARVTANPRCTPACEFAASAWPAVCFEGQLLPSFMLGAPHYTPVQRTVIAQDQPWALTAPPGLYFVQVGGGEFVAEDGLRGGAEGMFGLLVDPVRERAIVDSAPFYAACLASPSSDGGSDLAGGDAGDIEADGGVASDGG